MLKNYHKNIFIISLFLTLFLNCKKINHENLNQIWIENSYQNEINTYKSKSKPNKNKGWMKFEKNGNFICNINSSGCETKPIQYKIEIGKWKYISDSLIDVKNSYWGGKAHSIVKIIKLTPDELEIKFLVSERNKF